MRSINHLIKKKCTTDGGMSTDDGRVKQLPVTEILCQIFQKCIACQEQNNANMCMWLVMYDNMNIPKTVKYVKRKAAAVTICAYNYNKSLVYSTHTHTQT